MVKTFIKTIAFAVGALCLSAIPALSQTRNTTFRVENRATTANPEKNAETDSQERESLFPHKSLSLAFSHFTWGAEVGSSLDMTSHDLSTFDMDVVLGYKNSFLKLAGVGAGIHRSIHTGNNFIPVYGVLRTDFRKKPSPLFLNLQAGYSFNTVGDSGTMGDFYGALGLGVNLQQGKTAQSYVIMSLAYQYFSEDSMTKLDFDTHYIFFAKLCIGVNF